MDVEVAGSRDDQENNSQFHENEDLVSGVDFIDSEEISYLGSSKKRMRGKGLYIIVTLLIVAILGGLIYFFIGRSTSHSDALKIEGKVAMTAQELRDIVLAKKLTVYWAGPLDNTKYALIANKVGSTFVRYLPKGSGLNDTTTSYRVIATYVQKSAFSVTQSAGNVIGNVGFTNVDGNAIFYVKTRPTNVYIGVKGKDLQIEIYDPGIDQSLGLALIHNQVRQIS